MTNDFARDMVARDVQTLQDELQQLISRKQQIDAAIVAQQGAIQYGQGLLQRMSEHDAFASVANEEQHEEEEAGKPMVTGLPDGEPELTQNGEVI
jgi:hypothetical protein